MARRNRRRSQDQTQFWLVSFKIGTIVALLGVAGFYGYEVGAKLSQEELDAAHQELARLSAETAGDREKLVGIGAELARAQAAAEDYRKRYEAVAPSEQIAGLVASLRAKLATGLDPQRLALAINAAAPPRNCTGADSKRFIVRTAKYAGANSWVRFNQTVTVTADGVGEARANGETEEWFDPKQDVTVTFTVIGGKDSKVTGKLPLQHTLVAKNVEYRFTITPGVRGFVEVSGDHCEWRG